MGQPKKVRLTDSWYTYRFHCSRAYNLEILGSCLMLFNIGRGKETRQATPKDPSEGSQRSGRIGDLYELCEYTLVPCLFRGGRCLREIMLKVSLTWTFPS